MLKPIKATNEVVYELEAVDGGTVLVQPRCQPDRVGELQAHDGYRQLRRRLGQQSVEAQAAAGTPQSQTDKRIA